MKYTTPFRYYTEDIKRDIPIRDVIMKYTDIDVDRKGNISCPSPDHDDKKPSAHIYPDANICKCFSCNSTFDVFSIVMMNTGQSFSEACKTLLEDFNLPLERYSNIEEVRRERNNLKEVKEQDPFPLSIPDLKLLDLPIGSNIPNPDFQEWTYDEETKAYKRNGEIYSLPRELHIMPLQEQWNDKESRADIESIILKKCEDAVEKYNSAKDWYTHLVSTYYETHTKEDFKKEENLFMRLYDEKESLLPSFFSTYSIDSIRDIDKVNTEIMDADIKLNILTSIPKEQRDEIYPYIITCLAEDGAHDCAENLERVRSLMEQVREQHAQRIGDKSQKAPHPVPRRTYERI